MMPPRAGNGNGYEHPRNIVTQEGRHTQGRRGSRLSRNPLRRRTLRGFVE